MQFLIVASVGHAVFAAGTVGGGPWCLIVGRLLQGISYEVIDMMTLPLTTPYFQDIWALMGALVNGFIRLGSVSQFLLLPIIYSKVGLAPALWTASGVGASGLLFGLVTWRVESKLKAVRRGQACWFASFVSLNACTAGCTSLFLSNSSRCVFEMCR